VTAEELRLRYRDLRHKTWTDIDALIEEVAHVLEERVVGPEPTGPELDKAIRAAAKAVNIGVHR
jgi:hypothetical protein